MAKSRRTRKEKVIAQLRRKLVLHTLESQIEKPQKDKQVLPISKASTIVHAPNYSYVLTDIKRTMVITALIIILQAILFLNHSTLVKFLD